MLLFRSSWRTTILALCVSTAVADIAYYSGHFQHWYSGYSTLGPSLLENCSEQYELYQTHSIDLYHKLNSGFEPTAQSAWIHGLIVCMLQYTDELVKVEVAVSSVILGLLPTILVFASSSCIEIGLLAQTRPILTFLLAIASPGLNPLRRYEYYSQAQYILTQPDSATAGAAIRAIQPTKGVSAAVVSLLEYLLALAAIANVVHNTWQLTLYTVSAYAPQTAYQPLLWVCLAVFAHCLELGSMSLRLRCMPDRVERLSTEIDHGRCDSWLDWFRDKELQPCALHAPTTLIFEQETLFSRAFSWFCNKVLILFIIWGTFFFSSTLFVKVTDAIIIFIRYLASVIVSRLILQYELDGLSLTMRIPKWMQG